MYNALRTGSISHAYIINGDEGSGRKTLAYTFAAAMQCQDLQEEPATHALEPCGRCLSCIQSLSGNQPDTITITREKGKASIGMLMGWSIFCRRY